MEAIVREKAKLMLERYTNQAARMPAEVRAAIEGNWGNQEQIMLYAFADLDRSLKAAEQWVAIGSKHISIASMREDGVVALRSFPRKALKSVQERQGLTSTTLTLMGAPGAKALAIIRYTHRQKQAMGNLHFVLKERLEGREVPLGDADDAYAEAVVSDIRDAQALVSGSSRKVVWRLLSYLKPYRRTVMLGMSAALVMALAQLIPPFLTGRLIDQVIRSV